MNEVKSPKKPMLYYYAMALLVLLLINFCLLYTSPSPRDA